MALVAGLVLPAISSARSLSISDGIKVEGNSGAPRLTFAIKLSKASTKDVTVRVRTKDGTATSPADYAAKADTLKFKPGNLKKKIHVPLVADATPELNETFDARLYKATGANINHSHGTGTIIDDDTSVETEPNDTTAQANVYLTGTPLYSGSIDPLADTDFYSVTLGAPGTITAETFDHGASRCADLTDTQLTLFAPDGTTQLATNDDGGDGLCSKLTKPGLAAGTYYVEVASAVGTDSFEYALNISAS